MACHTVAPSHRRPRGNFGNSRSRRRRHTTAMRCEVSLPKQPNLFGRAAEGFALLEFANPFGNLHRRPRSNVEDIYSSLSPLPVASFLRLASGAFDTAAPADACRPPRTLLLSFPRSPFLRPPRSVATSLHPPPRASPSPPLPAVPTPRRPAVVGASAPSPHEASSSPEMINATLTPERLRAAVRVSGGATPHWSASPMHATLCDDFVFVFQTFGGSHGNLRAHAPVRA